MIEAKIIEDKLSIKEIDNNTKETLQGEIVPICTIVSEERHLSNVFSEDKHSQILLMQQLDDKDICVWCENGQIFYEISTIEKIYKTLVKVPYKFVQVRLTKKKIKIKILAYLLNRYKLNVSNIRLQVNNDNKKIIELNKYEEEIPKLKMLSKKFMYTLEIGINDLIKSEEAVNNNISIILNINGIDVQYKIGKRKRYIKAEKYYNLPIKSKYIDDYAVHIRRTIAGNFVIVKRPMEPIEKTKFFRRIESKPVSMVLYLFGKIVSKLRPKKVNIFYEKFASKAEEGVIDLFEHAQQSKKSKNYFVIDEHSDYYDKIKDIKNVVRKYSFKYYWLMYSCNCFIGIEGPSHLNILRSNNRYLRKAIYDKKFIFLQHGIIYMKNMGKISAFIKGRDAESDYIVVSSQKEKAVVQDMLKMEPDQILNTGLALYSNLEYKHINEKSDDVITIMLTWKPYEESLLDFEKSSYYKNILIIYDILKEKVKSENIKIVAHPKARDMLMSTSIKDMVWNEPISKVLEITKLLITDYSSVCYNVFYQGGAVIFYQPDLEVYEAANGPLIPADDEFIGERAFNEKELADILNNSIKDGKISLKKLRTIHHEEMYATINEFNDGKNKERIYSELQRIGIL